MNAPSVSLRIRVACVATSLLLNSFAFPLKAEQEKLDPIQVLPSTTLIYVEVAASSDWIQHPLRKQVERSIPFREIWNSPDVLKARGGIGLAELALGDRLESILQKLASKGMVFAIDGQTEGIVVLAQSDSKEWLFEYVEKILNLARGDAKNKDQPDAVKTAEYRGIRGYEVNKGILIAVDNTLLITNKSELAKGIIDRYLDKGTDGLGTVPSFQLEREQSKKGSSSVAWGYMGMDAIRERGIAKALLGGGTKDFGAELLMGGLFATLERTPYITGSLSAEENRMLLQLNAPHDASWFDEKREFFFGPNGIGDVPQLLEVNGILGSLSAYRDVSKLWLMAGDLFDQRVNDQLAQADNTLTTLFSGRDFGSDILGAFHPQMRILVAHQEPQEGQPIPTIRLPAFALIAQLKEPKTMKPELKRIFQSLVGFLNVAGAQNGQPQLDLDTESSGQATFVMARYVSEVDRKEGKSVPVQYNFSPCLAFVGQEAILSSTDTLAKQIVEQFRKPIERDSIKTMGHNTMLELDADSIRRSLEMNKDYLVSQNMLEKGHSKKEAEKEIGVLLQVIHLLDEATLGLDYSSKGKASLQIGLSFHVQEK